MSAISDKYAQLGGATGFLGAALSPEGPAANGGRKQEFQNGTIYWLSRTGAFEVHGMIRDRWRALGGEGSPFGYPTSDETSAADGVGRFNNFENASIFWYPATGAFEVHGLIRDRWRALGAESSTLGYPMTNETTTADGIGRYNHFQRGSIFWTPRTGAHEVFGAARRRWAQLRWERGLLGYPISTPFTEIRDRTTLLVTTFEHGRIEVDITTDHPHAVKFASDASPNYSIPVVAYRVSDDDGSRPCAITAAGVQQWVDEASRVFAAAGVAFSYDGALLDLRDTQVNNLTGEGDPFWVAARDRLNQLAAQRRSVVVVFRALVGGGFSSWTYDFVAMSFFDPNALGLLAHELGHHFGLPHTFGPIFQTVQDAEDYVLSGGAIDGLDGDRSLVDDTPPDPMIAALQTSTVDAIAVGGQALSLARDNIMSYWSRVGSGALSHSQIDRIRRVVSDRGARYLNVTTITPATCSALMARIAALRSRLAELILDRDAERDPHRRAMLAAACIRLENEIRALSDTARSRGCL